MHNFLFGIYPYIALAVLVVGSIARYERDPFTWKSSSSQFLRRKQLVVGSILFHVGVLVIFAGHLVGLLTPIWVFDFMGISHGAKQLLAVIAGGVAGIMALVGGGMLFHRRWTDPRIRATSGPTDMLILGLLLAQLVLGIGTIFVSLEQNWLHHNASWFSLLPAARQWRSHSPRFASRLTASCQSPVRAQHPASLHKSPSV